MTSQTITDPDGDTVRISTGSLTARPGHVTVKVNEKHMGREYAAAVHVDPRELRAALDEVAPAGSYPRTDEETRGDAPVDPEGECAADAAVRWMIRAKEGQHRALKAEQERDDWKCRAGTSAATSSRLLDERDDARREVLALRAEQPRPLTPDDITDRFLDDVHEDYCWSADARVRLDKPALKHALLGAVKRSQDPTRPEALTKLIDTVRESTYSPEPEALGEALYNAGVRVTGAES